MSFDRLAALLLDPGIPPLVIYTVLFFGCVLESFFPPWPADIITLYTGFLAGRGVLTPGTVFSVAVVGTQTGVMAAFWISRRWGRALLAGAMGRYLPTEQLGRLERWFARYGATAIAVSRFFPGIRALVTPAAGLAGFAAWKVWVFAGVSVLLWNSLIVGLGLLAGVHLDVAKRALARYNVIAGIIFGVLLVGWGLFVVYRRFARSAVRS